MKLPRSRPIRQNGNDVASPASYNRFDVVGDRTTSGAFVAELWESWENPDWFLSYTSLAGANKIPEQITVADYLRIIGNIFESGTRSDYFVDYLLAGVPLYRGGLDLGMLSAPDIRSALELVAEFANNRPGYHHHSILEDDGRIGICLSATVDLGPGRPILVEVPLFFLFRLASRCLGRPATEAMIELDHPAPPYAERLRSTFPCQIRFGAERAAITFPTEKALQMSKAYDVELWRIASFRCREEQERRAGEELLFDIKSMITVGLADAGRVPTLETVAEKLDVSSRTLARRLRNQGSTYQAITDGFLKARCQELLEQQDLSIAVISERLGFADPSSFYRSFRRWTRTTPGMIRKTALSGSN